jgi:Fic family protein
LKPPFSTRSTFVPAPLPPKPPVDFDGELLALLSEADLGLGRLDGLVKVIPDPDFFVGMYVRREAVLSSQIEGTQSTLEDLLEVELEPDSRGRYGDVGDIVNYIAAMNYGLSRLDELPLSLSDFERFLHADARGPLLVQVGLAHAQFETIHPFLDGNGRVGRLLITFLLVHQAILRAPLLYLSHYFKLHRAEYYDRLMAVRLRGDWEGWLRFFLRGVAVTSEEATDTAERIFALRERNRTQVMEETGTNGLKLLSALFRRPLVNVNLVAEVVDVTFPTANRLVGKFEELGILREVTGQRRSRRFCYEPYLRLFDEPVPTPEQQVPTEVTEAPTS